MKIYISCHAVDMAKHVANVLQQHGHEVTSTWHRPETKAPVTDEEWEDAAARNTKQIYGSDAFVMIASREHVKQISHVRGGKFVELGFALGVGLHHVYVVGGVENGMCRMPHVQHVANIDELIRELAN